MKTCGKRTQCYVFVFSVTSGSLLDYGETASLFTDRRLGGPQRQLGAVMNRTSSPQTRSGDHFPYRTASSPSTKLTTLSHSAQYSGFRTFILISLYSRSNTSFKNTRRDMLRCLYIRTKKNCFVAGESVFTLNSVLWVPHSRKNLPVFKLRA